MKVSLNWVRFINQKYGCAADPAPDGVDKLVEKIGAQLGAVEEVIELGNKYAGTLIVKVIECEKHPNADKLSLCLIDDGGVNKSVKRNEAGLIQIVCGAPNVKPGMLAAWIPPGSTVPATFDKDPFVIEARPIRNKTSHGMLASPKELDLGDSHEGILEVDTGKPGGGFAKTLGLDDTVIDIENKMFTHRPDLFGQLGIARELAGIQRQPFKSPDWYKEDAGLPADGRKNVLKLSVKNDVPKLVPRFCAVAIKDVKVGPSPAWLQVRLSSVGIRPINNIVDITNFYMMETAQPLHAYDYDKVKTGILGIRHSKNGEKLNLLDGKEITLREGAVVITDGRKPIGLGGVMGGADTEVDEKTRSIILECANFDMNLTRKTAMEYGLFTDAATRFSKNQSPRQNRAVIAKAADDVLRLAGGRIASPLVDDKHFDDRVITVKTDSDFINGRLGTKLAAPEILNLLSNVEFKAQAVGSRLSVAAPFWRTDIEIPEDIVEEVGRLHGYDKLPVVLPERSIAPVKLNSDMEFKDRLRKILQSAGANEVLSYSFIHGSLMEKAGQDPKDAYRIANALSPGVQYYRLSLTPSLLEKVHPNIRAGFDEFAIYEIGSGHVKGEIGEDKLPKEFQRLSLVLAGRPERAGAPYFAAKRLCDYLLDELGVASLAFEPLRPEPKLASPTYYEAGRSAVIKAGSKIVGRVGEYKSGVKSSLKLPSYCAGFELHISDLIQLAKPIKYQPLNRYPQLEQDFCLRSDASLSYQELTGFMLKNLSRLSEKPGYHSRVEPLDIFQKPGDKRHKQTTWRIILWHPERTLTTKETNSLLDGLAAAAKKEIKAERI